MLQLFRRPPQGYRDVSAEEVRDALQTERGVQLVDVRSREEYAQGHLPGAKLVPLGELESRFRKLHPDAPVIIYCLSGARSARAARFLAGHGFADVRNMRGGIRHWVGDLQR